MLEVGGVVDAGCQQDHVRRVAGPRAERRERVVKLCGVVVDRQDVRGLEQFRPDALDDHAVLEHVTHARGHAQVVFEHVDRAVTIAYEIRAADVRPDTVSGLHADALLAEVDRLGEDFGGKNAVPDDLLLAVDVLDEVVQRRDPLFQAALGLLPFLLRNDARDDVERPRSVEHLAFGINREGDAHDLDCQISRKAAVGEVLLGKAGEIVEQAFRHGTRLAVAFEQLVVHAVAAILAPIESHARSGSLGFWATPTAASRQRCIDLVRSCL